MKECQCIPWDMVRNDSQHGFELCDSGGNGCFWKKMGSFKDYGLFDSKCFCLSDCENVKYSQFATLKPLDMDKCTNPSDLSYFLGSVSSVKLNQKAIILSKMLVPMKNVSDFDKIVDKIMQTHNREMCEKIQTKDRNILRIRLEGPTFMILKRSQRVTFVDKLGSIGGTLGLFSGFSLLAIMELIHWILKIINSLIVSRK